MVWILIFLLVSLSNALCSATVSGLDALEVAVRKDLELINCPAEPWRDTGGPYDVVIIGGGMAGMSLGLALLKQGITHIKICDKSEKGLEGPWKTYARMNTLRSHKKFLGPALTIPHLTFRAWYTAQFGNQAWEKLDKAPTHLWADYLQWYKKVLNLPVENNCQLQKIIPDNDLLRLQLKQADKQSEVVTHKVILATGRTGFGGFEIPSFMKSLPKSRYAHTGQIINPEYVQGKDVIIIGTGASAFDSAAFALEHKARSVALLMRRLELPLVTKGRYLDHPGGQQGFYNLSKKYRWEIFKHIFQAGTTTPLSSLARIKKYSNVKLYPRVSIRAIHEKNNRVEVVTDDRTFMADYVILATGFAIDGTKQPELEGIIDNVKLWQDMAEKPTSSVDQKLGRFPFLGPHFEFLEKTPGSAPYLKNIHCFNYAAALTHGLVSEDISGIGVGAERLAQGIASDLFVEESQKHLEGIKAFNTSELKNESFSWLLTPKA